MVYQRMAFKIYIAGILYKGILKLYHSWAMGKGKVKPSLGIIGARGSHLPLNHVGSHLPLNEVR